MKRFYGRSIYVQSAGVKNDLDIDGFAIAVCAEIGVDLARHRVRTFEEMREWLTRRPYTGTARVNVGGFLETRDEALLAHASQVPPTATFFFWPNDVQRQAWPFEDYRLAKSRIETAEFEHDLFEGIEDSE